VTPSAILDAIKQYDVYYHVWVAVKRVTSEKLYVLCCRVVNTCRMLRRASRSSCQNVNLFEAAMNQFVRIFRFSNGTVANIILQLVEIGNALIDRVPGPHMTFIDTRLTRRSDIIKAAKDLVSRFEQSGVKRNMVVVSVSMLVASGGLILN
jgi:hypothetical protein